MPGKLSTEEYEGAVSAQVDVKTEVRKGFNGERYDESSAGKQMQSSANKAGHDGKPCIKEEPNHLEDDESAQENDVEVVAVSTNSRSGRISMRLRLKKEKSDTSPPPLNKRPRRSTAKGNKVVVSSSADEPIDSGGTAIKVETFYPSATPANENDALASSTVQIDVLDEETRRGTSQKEAQVFQGRLGGDDLVTAKIRATSREKRANNANLLGHSTGSDLDQEDSEWEETDEMDKDDPPWKPSVERRKPDTHVDRNLDQAVEGLIKDYTVDEDISQGQVSFPSPRPGSSSTNDSCQSLRDCVPSSQESVSLEFEGIVAVPVESTKCILCMALFKTTDELKAHMEIVHAKGRRQAKTRVTPVEESDSRKKAPTPLVREGAEAKPRRRKPRQAGNLGHHECHFCHKRFQQMGHLRNHAFDHTSVLNVVNPSLSPATSLITYVYMMAKNHLDVRSVENGLHSPATYLPT
ncbi:hypothetical protein BIW11_03494 [Tropilaelaps mercedesae]|uniref:C2H2-type domain-containing protein n=1 Tax=Tropilaelaps mercedesae TaxID=418985 RepID=A0A1V9XK73_9ACAR|nr:hypothetical protein BIW11_03494 [Tropilaelaps mercedesae]